MLGTSVSICGHSFSACLRQLNLVGPCRSFLAFAVESLVEPVSEGNHSAWLSAIVVAVMEATEESFFVTTTSLMLAWCVWMVRPCIWCTVRRPIWV